MKTPCPWLSSPSLSQNAFGVAVVASHGGFEELRLECHSTVWDLSGLCYSFALDLGGIHFTGLGSVYSWKGDMECTKQAGVSVGAGKVTQTYNSQV